MSSCPTNIGPKHPPLTTLSPAGARTSSPPHGLHISFSRMSTRMKTFAGSSSATSVVSWPMHSRSLPHFGQGRSSSGTAMGFGTRDRCSGKAPRVDGWRGGFGGSGSDSRHFASIPDTSRSRVFASSTAGVHGTPAGSDSSSACFRPWSRASRNNRSCAAEMPSFFLPRDSICTSCSSSSLLRATSFSKMAKTVASCSCPSSSFRSTSSTVPRHSSVLVVLVATFAALAASIVGSASLTFSSYPSRSCRATKIT